MVTLSKQRKNKESTHASKDAISSGLAAEGDSGSGFENCVELTSTSPDSVNS